MHDVRGGRNNGRFEWRAIRRGRVQSVDAADRRIEGIEEPIARIAGTTYLMNAARVLTCGAIDAGEKPGVISAVAKAYLTEGMRACVADGMDIMAVHLKPSYRDEIIEQLKALNIPKLGVMEPGRVYEW